MGVWMWWDKKGLTREKRAKTIRYIIGGLEGLDPDVIRWGGRGAEFFVARRESYPHLPQIRVYTLMPQGFESCPEGAGPMIFRCPEKVMRAVPPPNPLAEEWRRLVRLYRERGSGPTQEELLEWAEYRVEYGRDWARLGRSGVSMGYHSKDNPFDEWSYFLRGAEATLKELRGK